jgi:predicted nucleic acid-binding protein
MLVPPLFLSEITNALYLSVRRHRLTLEEARLALLTIMQVGLEVAEPAGLYPRSLDLAAEYDLTNAYDSQYIALAEIENCELWTADERLVRAVKPSPSWLRLI